MDNREAKFILSAYRPSGQDANDPRFGEALGQARRDPILERWFRESVEFDAAVTEKLRSVSPPSDLRDSILAGGRLSRPSRWRNELRRWAIAAALIMTAIFGALVAREKTKPRLAEWQTAALSTISSLVDGRTKFDAQSSRAAELGAWLQANRAPAANHLPPRLETLPSLGCKTFSWNGNLVSVICFQRADGGLIHLVIANASATSNRAINGEPEFVQRGDWVMVTWREGDKVCMLALEGSRDQLRSYLL